MSPSSVNRVSTTRPFHRCRVASFLRPFIKRHFVHLTSSIVALLDQELVGFRAVIAQFQVACYNVLSMRTGALLLFAALRYPFLSEKFGLRSADDVGGGMIP